MLKIEVSATEHNRLLRQSQVNCKSFRFKRIAQIPYLSNEDGLIRDIALTIIYLVFRTSLMKLVFDYVRITINTELHLQPCPIQCGTHVGASVIIFSQS